MIVLPRTALFDAGLRRILLPSSCCLDETRRVPTMAPFGSALQNGSAPLAYGTRSVDISDFVEILDILSDSNKLNKSHPTTPP